MKQIFSFIIINIILWIGIYIIQFGNNISYYFESRDIPKTIFIDNNTNYNINNFSKIIINKVLCIDTLLVHISYMPEEFEYRGNLKAFVIKIDEFNYSYSIFLSRTLNKNIVERVISHEFAHIEQFEKKHLKQIDIHNGIYRYYGFIFDTKLIPYNFRPFEIDAFIREDEILIELQNILYN